MKTGHLKVEGENGCHEKNPERWEDKQKEECSRIKRRKFQGQVLVK